MIKTKAIHAINHSNNIKRIKQKLNQCKESDPGISGEKIALPLMGSGTKLLLILYNKIMYTYQFIFKFMYVKVK